MTKDPSLNYDLLNSLRQVFNIRHSSLHRQSAALCKNILRTKCTFCLCIWEQLLAWQERSQVVLQFGKRWLSHLVRDTWENVQARFSEMVRPSLLLIKQNLKTWCCASIAVGHLHHQRNGGVARNYHSWDGYPSTGRGRPCLECESRVGRDSAVLMSSLQ